MDGGGNVQGYDERGAEKAMDEHLKSLGLHRKKIAKDGSCLFRAVAEQVLHCQSLHTQVRAQCVEFLKENRGVYEAFIEGDFEDYLCKLQDPQVNIYMVVTGRPTLVLESSCPGCCPNIPALPTADHLDQQWVGEVEINALAAMYKRDFLIYQEPGKPAVAITDNNFKEKVQLCFLNGNHYDSVYPITHIRSAAVCQSILYELLYDGVFKVDPGTLSGLCQRTNRPSYLLSDDNMPACVSSDESELDSSEALRVENGTTSSRQSHRGRGRGRLSDRVKRSLSQTLYRNVEYDVWQKSKRAQQKMDYCIAAGMQYIEGDRCQVRLESGGRSYNATIKEVPPNNGLVTVYIEELGKKQVPLWSIRPSNDENSWSTVINRDKKLINGHGDWEERGKGRGRGKSIQASSSVAQSTGPGCGGRMQKQHSVEEHGGTKASRKSVNTSESVMFGLTAEQRLAREEEERNVALVEIQLRDEQSFPALGAQPVMQSEGGKRKGGEKKRSQRNRTKSPVEEVKALSPSAGEHPKSSTPTLATTTATTSSTTNTTKPANPTLPAAKPPAPPAASSSSTNAEPSPSQLSSLKSSAPNTSVTGAAPGSIPKPPLTFGALTTKVNTQSYASAAGAPPSSPPPPAAVAAATAATSTEPPVTGGAHPHSVPSSASVFSIVTPVLPAASSTSSSSFLPPKTSATSPPSSSVPHPTFIAPIAPSPVAAQGFLSTSSFPRSSPPFSPLPHSASPPSFSPQTNQKSSSSVIHHAAQVQEAPQAPAQPPNFAPHAGGTAPQTLQSQGSLSQIHPQVCQPQNQSQITVSPNQTQASLPLAEITTQPSFPQIQTQSPNSTPQNKILMPQMQMEAQCSVPYHQPQPQSQTEVTSLPQPQMQPAVPQASISHLQPQSQAQYTSLTQSEFTQTLSSQPPPGASYPNVPQAAVPVSAPVQPQLPFTHPHSQLVQSPHPSQVPRPLLSLAASLTHPSLQSQTPNTQDEAEAPSPAIPQLQPQPQSQPEPPVHTLPQQPHPLHPLLHPPPHPQSIPGAVPLQTFSQLYQDPLYPGFPQGENGSVAPTPPFSLSKSGDDLPQDVNILRFFFNLGVKAYTLPMFGPCVYLMPLQQAYTINPKPPSRSSSPTPPFPPSNPLAIHQETYPQYPPNSASVTSQYELQTPGTEPPHPSEPSFSQAAYPVTQASPHRMAWQQHQVPTPRNSSYPVGYPSTTPPYPVTLPQPQGYPSGEDPGHPAFPPAMSQYPPSSLGYHQSSNPEEFQGNKATVAHHQPANGDTMHSRVPGPLESAAAANVANANNNRTMVIHGANSFGFKKEQEESVLLVDPPLNNKPIHVNMTTMKTSSTPGAHDIISKPKIPIDNNPSRVYRGPRKPYVMEQSQAPCLQHIAMSEGLSVGCSTEDDWEEEVFNPSTLTHRGPRRTYRGGRGRGGHDGGRGGQRRRQDVGFNHSQHGHFYGGQSWGRGY